jgi:hypothetical protein
MPTSNGLVTGRDLRRGLLNAAHFPADPLIGTDFIQDQAITFPDKIDDPPWVHVFESNPGINVSLDTDYQEYASTTISIPAWVDQIHVLAIGIVAINNSSGGALHVYSSTRVNGEDDGAFRVSVANNFIGHAVHCEEASRTGVAGSTITVDVYSKLDSGTNSVNKGAVWGIVLGSR